MKYYRNPTEVNAYEILEDGVAPEIDIGGPDSLIRGEIFDAIKGDFIVFDEDDYPILYPKHDFHKYFSQKYPYTRSHELDR